MIYSEDQDDAYNSDYTHTVINISPTFQSRSSVALRQKTYNSPTAKRQNNPNFWRLGSAKQHMMGSDNNTTKKSPMTLTIANTHWYCFVKQLPSTLGSQNFWTGVHSAIDEMRVHVLRAATNTSSPHARRRKRSCDIVRIQSNITDIRTSDSEIK
jgi:hypothetical protein